MKEELNPALPDELKERDMPLEYAMTNASELIHNKVMKINFLGTAN